MQSLVDQGTDLLGYGTDVATTDPLSTVLVLIGTVLMLVSLAIFGGLTLGAVVGGVTRALG